MSVPVVLGCNEQSPQLCRPWCDTVHLRSNRMACVISNQPGNRWAAIHLGMHAKNRWRYLLIHAGGGALLVPILIVILGEHWRDLSGCSDTNVTASRLSGCAYQNMYLRFLCALCGATHAQIDVVAAFRPNNPVALSNVAIVGGALANFAFNWRRRHPPGNRSLIDWCVHAVLAL